MTPTALSTPRAVTGTAPPAAVIPFPSREEFARIVAEINATAARLRELRRLQATASLTERHALRREVQAAEDAITALYERKRAWHARHEAALHVKWEQERRTAQHGPAPLLVLHDDAASHA